MTAYKLQRIELQSDEEQLYKQLETELMECSKVRSTGRNLVRDFMVENRIWHISELNYPLREKFAVYLEPKYSREICLNYIKAFDHIVQHVVQNQIRVFSNGQEIPPAYENKILFLPYYPDARVAEKFRVIRDKEHLVWDFTRNASEKMKRQIYKLIQCLLKETYRIDELRIHLVIVHRLYDFCIKESIEDIEQLELVQEKAFFNTPGKDRKNEEKARVVEYCRRMLFIEAEEIHWNAPVWYLERLNLQPERINPSNPVRKFSFLEVTHIENRNLLMRYIKYGLGVTDLTISSLRKELTVIRNFLVRLEQGDECNVCMLTEKQIGKYFQELRNKQLKASSYNDQVIAIATFFNFLWTRHYIERIPFHKEYYLQKEIIQHHDRGIEQNVIAEILEKLPCFPENIRFMFLHLLCLGLRLSEVCTLKGDAYYIEGEDAWIQVYQIKMKNYKRIPIPSALYKLMKVYLKKYQIGPNDYIFQNNHGGAYHVSTFQWKMKEECKKNQIQNGKYLFRSHDFRHVIATFLYNNGMPLQSVRDYLGHDYEEMTQQYVDYMPKKIEQANEEYFNQHNLAARFGKEVRQHEK